MDAVASDRGGGHDVGQGRAIGVAKEDPRPAARVRHADALVAEEDAIGADPLAHGSQQHGLQISAMDRQLRRRMTCPAAEGLAVDELAEAVVEGSVACDDRDALEVGKDAERLQHRARVWQDIDADAERPDLGGRLVDPAGDVRAVQRQRERQAADAGADDGDLVAASASCANSGHDRGGAYGAAKSSPQRDLLCTPCAS